MMRYYYYNNSKNKSKPLSVGFTLVELLVVITILGVLATIGLVSFASAQARGRDAQRKSDLKQIASSLELYYSDYGKYPNSDNGKIQGCPSTSNTDCEWGVAGSKSDFTDLRTTYFASLPKDPSSDQNYYYLPVTVGSVNQGFQLYARLENSQDLNCLPGVEGTPSCSCPVGIPTGVTCGLGPCNFSVTSSNITPTSTPAP
jgi:general secretion pathway protein G